VPLDNKTRKSGLLLSQGATRNLEKTIASMAMEVVVMSLLGPFIENAELRVVNGFQPPGLNQGFEVSINRCLVERPHLFPAYQKDFVDPQGSRFRQKSLLDRILLNRLSFHSTSDAQEPYNTAVFIAIYFALSLTSIPGRLYGEIFEGIKRSDALLFLNDALIMRSSCTIGGHAFCMMAALFLALSPLSHGLHLASWDHSHGSCNTHHTGHDLSAPACFQGKFRYTQGAENHRVAISCSQAHGCGGHDPSTCPFCLSFAQLVLGQGVPPAQAAILQQKTPMERPLYGHTIPDRIAFSKVFPRAPPAC
jgi:hypothetical protein